jgi:hypothetical protein
MLSEEQNPAVEKRTCGHTGPTTEEGRATSARNATRHGMCAITLILDHENEADWLQLLNTWRGGYQTPPKTRSSTISFSKSPKPNGSACPPSASTISSYAITAIRPSPLESLGNSKPTNSSPAI